ncbi:HXXEE domain-containing protein [Paenibacillus elgii]|uniref:HXXEE domain-containing protein n=1 Tax=Paenibacillus elgii TaxID=189691 RepID=UPI00203F87DB|nr:HXXEE domain-containing protein [Paenibacillus elgii]MCM3270813.1 HXXEE domain-containing protein [Paenibacillus elgii]
MLALLNDWISLHTLIWLLPVAFFLHDGEEIVVVERWIRPRKHTLPPLMQRALNWDKSITVQFATAVALIGSLICLGANIAATAVEDGGKLGPVFVGMVAVMLLDGIKHVGLSLLKRSYTVGAVTAALMEIPYASYALYRFYEADLVESAALWLGMGIVLPLVFLLIGIGFTFGRWIAPYRRPVAGPGRRL